VAGHAGDIDDAAFATGHHPGSEFLARQEQAPYDVQVEVGLPISQRDVFEELFAGHGYLGIVAARSVDEDSWRTERFLDGLVRGMQALLLDGIGRKKSGLAAFLFYGSDPSIAALAFRPSRATFAPAPPRPSANAPPKTPVAPITTAT